MKHKILLAVGVVLLMVALVRFISFLTAPSPLERIGLERFAALGFGVAEEAAKRLNNQGNVLVIDSPDRPAGNEMDEARLEAFRDAAERSGLKVVAVEKLPAEISLDAGIPAAAFMEILGKHREVDAIVSFGGAPPLPQKDTAEVGPTPKFFLGSGGYSSLRKLLEAGAIEFAVEHVYGEQVASANPRTPREAFDTYYRVVTLQTMTPDDEDAVPRSTEEEAGE